MQCFTWRPQDPYGACFSLLSDSVSCPVPAKTTKDYQTHSCYQSSYGGNQPSRPVPSETLSSTPSPPTGQAVFWAQKTLKAPEPIRVYCINSAAWRRKQCGLWCLSDLLFASKPFLCFWILHWGHQTHSCNRSSRGRKLPSHPVSFGTLSNPYRLLSGHSIHQRHQNHQDRLYKHRWLIYQICTAQHSSWLPQSLSSDINKETILVVMNTTELVVEIRLEKKFRPVRKNLPCGE